MDTKKRQPNAWVQAVKLYNAQRGEGSRYVIPRKPKEGEAASAEYLAVRELMNKVSRPVEAPKVAPKAARAPRKALPVVAEAAEEVAVSAGPARKVRKAKTAVAEVPAEAPAPAEEPAKRGRGRPRKALGSPKELSETDYKTVA